MDNIFKNIDSDVTELCKKHKLVHDVGRGPCGFHPEAVDLIAALEEQKPLVALRKQLFGEICNDVMADNYINGQSFLVRGQIRQMWTTLSDL